MFLKINLLLKYSGVQLFLWQICVHFSKFLKINLLYFWCLFSSSISALVPRLCVMSLFFFFFRMEGALFFCLIPCGYSGLTLHLFAHRRHGFSLPFLLAFVCSWRPSRNVKSGFPAWEYCVLESPNPFTLNFPASLLQSWELEAPGF